MFVSLFVYYYFVGEAAYLDICQLSNRESDVRLSDKGEHDTAVQEFWLKVHTFREILHRCKRFLEINFLFCLT